MHAPVPDRLIKTRSDQTAIDAGCWFDQQSANRVRQFFSRFIVHTTGKQFAGKPFELLDWEWFGIIEPLFGWKRPNGTRRFRVAYLSVPKKNGKSTILAGIAAYLLVGDNEPGAEVYSAAADRHQAGIIFREAAKMVTKSPHLASLITANKKVLLGPDGTSYQALSREAGTKEGLNAHAILFDELHAQKGRELWDCLRYSGAARSQPLLLSITTAGGDLETICGEQYRYACNVRDGHKADDIEFFQYIAEANKEDDWADEAIWKKANPSYGVTIDAEDFRTAYLEARDSPAKENSFRRYRLNQWVQKASAWLSMDQWDACNARVDAENLKGRKCFAGLDLSATDDTTALVLAFPDPDGTYDLLSYFWLPEDNIVSLERKHNVSYRAWAKAGNFILTPGNVVDYAEVRKTVKELAGQFGIEELAIDRKFQGQSVETDLIAEGLPVVPAGQGWISQDVPAKELERLLKSARLRHGGHPVLRWHASNVCVDIDKNGNYSINKKKSRSKIDGIAATLMALFSRMQRGGISSGPLYVNENPSLLML